MTQNTIEINELEARKEQLRKEIAGKEAQISQLWDTLFYAEEDNALKTPTQRMLSYANTAAGLFDGAMLGWKLYRRLHGAFSFRKTKKSR